MKSITVGPLLQVLLQNLHQCSTIDIQGSCTVPGCQPGVTGSNDSPHFMTPGGVISALAEMTPPGK